MTNGYYITLTDSDGNTELIEPEDMIRLRAPVEDSVINEWEVTVPYDEGYDPYRHADAVVEFEDSSGTREIERRGPVDLISHDDKKGETMLRGRGEFARLEKQGPTLPFIASGVAWEEIERLWENIPGWSASVTAPTPDEQTSGRVFQTISTETEWSDTFEPVSDLPYRLDTDTLTIHPTCWTADTPDYDASLAFVRDTSSSNSDHATYAEDASNGEYTGLLSDSQEISYVFSIGYDLAWEDFDIAFRWGHERDAVANQNEPFNAGLEFTIDGPGISSGPVKAGEFPVFSDSFEGNWHWGEMATNKEDLDTTLTAGTYTITISNLHRFENTSDTESGYAVDVIAPVDTRWNYVYDDSVNTTGGYLDGPGYYPVGLDPYPVPAGAESNLNVPSGTVTVTPVSASQVDVLQLRAGDEDEPWKPIDPAPTSSQTVDFELSTGVVQGRVSLNARRGLSERSQTPRLRYEAEAITDWEITVDESDLQFFSANKYTGNWFDIVQEIHQDAGMVFRTIPDQSKSAESFELGDKSDTAEWTRTGFKKEFGTTDFANKIVAVGEAKERLAVEIRSTNSPVYSGETAEVNATVQFNDPPVVVVKDEDSINAVGVHQAYIKLNTDDRGELRNEALAELRSRLRLDERTGQVQIVPQRLKPGYKYTVPAFDGAESTLRRQTFQDVGGATCRLDFRIPQDVTTAISGVRKEARE